MESSCVAKLESKYNKVQNNEIEKRKNENLNQSHTEFYQLYKDKKREDVTSEDQTFGSTIDRFLTTLPCKAKRTTS